MKQPVTHYSDGRSAWQSGVLGFFLRMRGIAITIILAALTMGAPWWWPSTLPSNINVNLKLLAIVFLLLLGFIFVIGFIYLRHRSKRSLDTVYYLHRLAHDIRDKQTELHSKLAPGKKYSKGKLNKELELFLAQACENIVNYFRLLTSDQSICAAIRLARYDNTAGKIVYKTYARSKGLNSQRKKSSEVIQVNQGIPRFLRDEKAGSRYFCESLFWASQPKQAAKT